MDPVITARVLKMANSATYSRGQHVESIEQAAIKLGLNKLGSLVIASKIHLDQEIVFTCSLMHNIGELLIQSALPEEAGLTDLSQAQMIIHRFPEMLLTQLQAVQQQGNELTELLMQDVA
ncbi:HDOD domain-containing protein [Moritella sp. 28]|uniref:HDOD domain-containing protein n=1 Tax=Moritella sp. 28 TaxID=2746232 RepID=UPI001BABC450|nr:HDOD domain-containing protein [Moritella sp. 28]QUM83105.1 HDOD domain-containing protein [Moritella sp. 28]